MEIPDRIDTVVTDSEAPAKEVATWRTAGVEVITTDASGQRKSLAPGPGLRRVVALQGGQGA